MRDNGEAAAAEPAAESVVSGPTLIRFWGVRGSIPTPGRGTAVDRWKYLVRRDSRRRPDLILDAGSGIRRLGQALMKEFCDQPD